MTRLILPLALIPVLAVVALASAQGNSGDVSIAASANPTVFRAPVAITGKIKGVKAPTNVTLQRRSTTTAPYTDVATLPSTNKGEYSFTINPRRNGFFRAVARTTPEVFSDDLALAVSPKVGMSIGNLNPMAGSKVRFYGKVRPKHNGRRVQIQRRDDAGAFVTVAKVKLVKATSAYSKYSRRLTISSTGVYRALLPAHSDHAEGVSAEKTITTR